MSAQKGRDLLLKVETDTPGMIQTVAGLRASTLSFNAESVDITNQESSGQWRELLAGAGARQASLRGQGIFKDAASDALIRQTFFNGTLRTWQIVIPDFGIVSGLFQITAFEIGGRHDAEVTFELSLASAGPLAFAAI